MSASFVSLRRAPRRGGAAATILALLAVIAAAGGVGWYVYNQAQPKEEVGPLLQPVLNGPFDHVVLEQGEVESGTNVEIRCEVKSRGTSGITILEVVPEGTMVKAGDQLARLDSTALDQERIQQQITVNTSQALVVQAKNTYEASVIARTEYLEGTFKQEERTILGEVFVAEQNLRSAQLAFQSTQRLASKNIVTSLQLEGSGFAVEKARNELLAAQGKLEVLRKYTKEKMLKTLNSDIATSEAKLKAEESSHALETQKLKDVEEQIAKCTLTAPTDGQVVYVNKYSGSRGGSTAEFVVEAGATVREQQPLFRLPDGKNMQIRALVNESRITMVRPGLPVAIRVDALKDEMLQGEVVKVNQYAEPGGWTSGTVKKYAAIVKIADPPPHLRVGMNSEVRIYVERRPEALQVPVQALKEHKGHFFAVVSNGEDYVTKEVKVAATNDQTAVIAEGLTATDKVVMNPDSHPDKLQIPEIKDAAPVKIAGTIERSAGATPVAMAVGGAGGNGPPAGNGPPGGSGPGGAPGGRRPSPGERFKGLDANGDGKLSAEEMSSVPEQFRAPDTDNDGFVSMAEYTAHSEKMRAARAQQGGGPGPGGPGGGGGAQ